LQQQKGRGAPPRGRRLGGVNAFIDKPGRGAYLSGASFAAEIAPFSGAMSCA
jgi:hypothetical protein